MFPLFAPEYKNFTMWVVHCTFFVSVWVCEYVRRGMWGIVTSRQAEGRNNALLRLGSSPRSRGGEWGMGRCVWSEQGRGAIIVQSRVEGNHLSELDVCHINLGVCKIYEISLQVCPIHYPLSFKGIHWEGHTQNKNCNYFSNHKRPLQWIGIKKVWQ